ncbi:MAG: xanthine dehydrogenase family protein molybdopterin-binding subunit [Acidobacteriota bacterium]|nr:xanthine dehydrogenase family protein molybdopterin-binding subunit [Acidobacteriota bacterium]
MSETSVGKPIDRVDGRRKVTGAARYSAEHRPAGLVHGVLVTSKISKGRVTSIDVAKARAMRGVLAILRHGDAPKVTRPKSDFMTGGILGEERMPFADDVVSYAGQAVALVVAETLQQARHAASMVRVSYQQDTPVLEMRDPRAESSYPKQVFGEELQYKRGDVTAALAAPGVVRVEAVYTTPVETHNPMELSVTVAEWNGDKLVVHDSTQYVMGTRAILAESFGIPRENVRVICPFVGGGFGCKGFQWPHEIMAAMAARAVRRPVRIVLSRAEMFSSAGHRPPTIQTMTLAASPDGKLTAIRHETLQPSSPLSEYVEACGHSTSPHMYACANVEAPHRLVRVNVATPTPMRAPGECPGTWALESAMDELAVKLSIDPLELRLRNHADVDPSSNKPFSSKYLKECYALGAEKFGWARRSAAARSMRDGDLLVGWGVATATYPGYRFPAAAKITLGADGTALIRTAAHDLGTGAYTVLTQVAVDALGIPEDRVRLELGDSDFPFAPVAGGSNTTASVSEAIFQASAAMRDKLAGLAGASSGSPLAGIAGKDTVLSGGRLVSSADRTKSVDVKDLVRAAGGASIEAEAFVKPDDEKAKAYSFHSCGVQFCEVKIDPLLPRVRVTRVVSVMDIGRVLNPKTSRSQILGGVTMGLGMALMEHTAYDPRTGRPVTDNLADYAVPVNADVESIEGYFIDKPDPQINTLGCRGVGEIGITGVAAAVANAVYHATGVRVRDLPITPDKLLGIAGRRA